MNVVLGFVLLLLLGFAASRLALFQGRFSLGTQYMFLAGTEFLLIGLVMGPRVSNILNYEALRQLSPILSLGLGWIGLLIGLQFDWREINRIPVSIWMMGAAVSVVAFSVSFIVFYLLSPWVFHRAGLMVSVFDEKGLRWTVLGMAFLLGWIGTVSTSSALVLLKKHTGARGEAMRLIQVITEVRSPIAISVMGLWYCLNHSSIIQYPDIELSLSRSLPVLFSDTNAHAVSLSLLPVMSGLEWVVLTLLIGVSLGGLLHYLTNHRLGENEILLLLTGVVILSGGLSSYLHLSPLFVNLIMGATLANIPTVARSRITKWMVSTEKPFYVVFMILVGSMWPPISPLVLGFAFLYIGGRAGGLCLGGWIAGRLFLPKDRRISNRLGLAMLPQGGVALAMGMDYFLIHPGAMAEVVLGVVVLAVLIQQLFGPSLLAWGIKPFGDLETGRRAERRNDTAMEPVRTREGRNA